MAPGPVQDLVHVLESHGIVCLRRDLIGTRKNALVATSGRRRAVVFIDPRPDREDASWAVAHELGHLVLHETAVTTQEEQSDEFAGEFLAPRAEVTKLIGSGVDAEDLPDRFSMPPPAFAVHARRNSLISQADYRALRKQSVPPWNRTTIPGPRRISDAVQERVNGGETIRDVAASAFLSEDELRRDYL
ncbi:ImmA/IrrE family metallo-endopeptidase [Microbacterium sp.]|uniref:ImmA/IrrE family metallo-endopeptidase n=1 Tax=Microbacterium sp. TaxID=51671 RepID=UPI00356AF829